MKAPRTPCPYDEGEDNHPTGIDGKPCELCRRYISRVSEKSPHWILQRKARVTRWATCLGKTGVKEKGKAKGKVVNFPLRKAS